MQSLVLQKILVGVQAALDAVPATLEQTYCNILLRTPLEDPDPLSKRSCGWLFPQELWSSRNYDRR